MECNAMKGYSEKLESMISEEALLFAKYLRRERKEWIRRTVNLQLFSS
jgi:hypothetical protein